MYIYAVELYFDKVLEAKIIEIWKKLAQAGITRSMLDITCVRPHITLAVLKNCDPQHLIPLLKRFAADTCRIPVTLSYYGIFPSAAFLGCTTTFELLELHSRFYRGCCSELPSEHLTDFIFPGIGYPIVQLLYMNHKRP